MDGPKLKPPLPVPKVLLVGNYAPDGQNSMRIFCRSIQENLRSLGVQADAMEPSSFLGRHAQRLPGFRKLFGYLDKYVFFPISLRARADQYDCVHIIDHSNAPYRSFLARKPVIVTCHDLFAVRIMQGKVAGQQFGLTGRLLQKWVLASLKRTQNFTCVSQATADELVETIGEHARIRVIPNALSRAFHPMERGEILPLLSALGLSDDQTFFLHVGGNTYYKNRPGIVRLFEHLGTDPRFADHRLVLAGKAPDAPLREAIAASGMADRITVAVEPEDATIRALYSAATALLFISLEEGFGWPIIEAQACGCPVVTTDADPMRTVAAGAAILVDPLDPDGAARAIIGSADRFDSLREAGLENVRRFGAESIFPQYLEVYREACSSLSEGN